MTLIQITLLTFLLSIVACKKNTPVGNGHLVIEEGFNCSLGYQQGKVEFVFVSTFPLDSKKSGDFKMGSLTKTGNTYWTKKYQCNNGSPILYSVGVGVAEVAGHKFNLDQGELFILKKDFTVKQIDVQFEDYDKDALSTEVNSIYKSWRNEQQ